MARVVMGVVWEKLKAATREAHLASPPRRADQIADSPNEICRVVPKAAESVVTSGTENAAYFPGGVIMVNGEEFFVRTPRSATNPATIALAAQHTIIFVRGEAVAPHAAAPIKLFAFLGVVAAPFGGCFAACLPLLG